MKRALVISAAGAVLALGTVLVWLELDRTYVNTFSSTCITVRDEMSYVRQELLKKFPGCRVDARGIFEGAQYSHVECGDSHTPNGHVLFNSSSACTAFAELDPERQHQLVIDWKVRKEPPR